MNGDRSCNSRAVEARPSGKTVFLNGSYAPSLINFRGSFIKAMISAGHQVHVTAPRIRPRLAAMLEALGAQVHSVELARAGISPLADLRYCRRIRTLAQREGADLVVSYTIKPNVWASLAAKSAGVRSASIVTGLGYTFIEGEGIRRKLIGMMSRLLYRIATACNDVVIFQNPDDRTDFIAAGCLGDPAKARIVNGSGVDLHYFRQVPLPEQPVFLMIGRLLVNKGSREYAEAALKVLERRRDCRFLLAGFLDEGPDGIAPEELERWAAGGVEFLGKLDDVRAAISSASVYVLPSYREGTPRTVLEAMAMGRPIVTTDVPGCRETVIEGQNGFLVPPRDASALAQAMEKLAGDVALRIRMGARSRIFCEEKYDVERVDADLMRYLSLVPA